MANPTFAKKFYAIKSSTLLQVLDTLSDCMLIEEVNPDKVSNTCELLQIEMEGQEVKEDQNVQTKSPYHRKPNEDERQGHRDL